MKGKTESKCLLTPNLVFLSLLMLDSLKFKECSFSSFTPHEAFFFLVIFEEAFKVGANRLKKAGLKSP